MLQYCIGRLPQLGNLLGTLLKGQTAAPGKIKLYLTPFRTLSSTLEEDSRESMMAISNPH